MKTSLFLAKLIGPLLTAIGLGLLLNYRIFEAMGAEFLGSYALIYLSGLLALLGGLTIVNLHNAWTRDWRVIITVLGWLAVIGGVVRIVLPQVVASIGTAIFAQHGVAMVAAIGLLVVGCFLAFKGYWETDTSLVREQ